jgi:spermidine synthase
MKSFIYPEMMTHVALCTSKDPKNVLLISNNAKLLTKEVEKHNEVSCEVVECNVENLKHLDDDSFDVIICEMESEIESLTQINRVLKDDGQLVINHPHLDAVELNKAQMQLLGYFFKIIMPFNLGNGETALLASKEYHPTADIILQRSDMLDNIYYYNCDIHGAAFAMPNYIRKTYLGFIKN